MKFSLFVHMERSDLAKPHSELFAELEELVLLAEEAGFETAWIGEHHGMEFTISPNPFINIAYLGAKTSTIRLGTGTIVAPFWHPIKLAGEAAMADVITGGRLDIGIARGAYSYEYERLAARPRRVGRGSAHARDDPGAAAACGTAISNSPASSGRSLRRPRRQSRCRQPYPPIWVAARDPNSHDFAVANKCNVQVTPLASGDGEVASLMERFNTACAAHPEIAAARDHAPDAHFRRRGRRRCRSA